MAWVTSSFVVSNSLHLLVVVPSPGAILSFPVMNHKYRKVTLARGNAGLRAVNTHTYMYTHKHAHIYFYSFGENFQDLLS